MEEVREIIVRYPERELDIQRLCRCDIEFRSICGDYGEAATALRRLRGGRGADDDDRTSHYAAFLVELEIEILARLSRSHPSVRSCDNVEFSAKILGLPRRKPDPGTMMKPKE